jgi:hypothetical protein
VQNLINKVPHNLGGPLDPLKVDGFCGKITNTAIAKVQARLPGPNTVSWLIFPGDRTMKMLDAYDLSEFIDNSPRPAPPPPPPAPKLVSTRFTIMVSAKYHHRMVEPEHFFVMITDEVNLGMRALYYLGDPPFPQLPHNSHWSPTDPIFTTTTKPMSADDWAGQAIIFDKSSNGQVSPEIHFLPMVLGGKSVRTKLTNYTQPPSSGPGSVSVITTKNFNLIDSSSRHPR